MGSRRLFAILLLLSAACGGRERARLPHIVLITSDTLRADHLSLNGYPRETSPEIDAFASRAWHFPEAVTVIPKTAPSFATIFTGRHPQRHGVRSNFDAVPPTLPVLAERLRALGYRTAAFVGNPVLRAGLGFDRGFEHYRLFDGRHDESSVLPVNAAFLEWAQGPWDRPTFVWIHYMDPHGPYTPPDEILRPFLEDELARSERRVPLEVAASTSGNPDKVLGALPAYQRLGDEDRVAVYVARYDAEIRLMDGAFGELIAFLERRKLYERSAIVFTSDHGESLGEHDYYFEHGWLAHDPGLRVPLMIKPPGEQVGRVVAGQVSNLDLHATLEALAGLPPPDGTAGPADLLRPLAPRPPLLIESSDGYPDKYHGLRTSELKYLMRAADGAEELYDLQADPGELRNLAADERERLIELRAACAEALRRARESAGPPAPGLPDDPQTLERLESLGYVGD